MAIKSGELIHVGNQVLIDRAQTAGPGTLNIPTERIYELGNYKSLAVIRDIPDLSFSLESLDASAQLEALLTGAVFATLPANSVIDLSKVVPIDVASIFMAGITADDPYAEVASVALPYLVPDSISYRYGLSQNAAQTVTLRGDSIYYAQGSCYVETSPAATVNAATPANSYALAHTALVYDGDTLNGPRYVTNATIAETGLRLLYGVDYTEVVTGAGPGKQVTIQLTNPVPTGTTLRVIYQSDVPAEYPQASHAPVTAVRPAAIRGRDIEVRVGGTAITNRWSSVQSAQVDWRVTLTRSEEFGSNTVISQDFEIPDVTGTIEIKPRNTPELLQKIYQASGITDFTQVVGAFTSVPLELQVILHSPEPGGEILKILEVPDARFTLPGYSGRVQTQLSVSLPITSDNGTLLVHNQAV